MWRFVVSLAWRDLRDSGRVLVVFCACLLLGVSLVAASGGLFGQVSRGLLADTRALFGGDLEVSTREPLAARALEWMGERGQVSLLVELRTMLATGDGRLELVELQSVDDRYPLYGEIELDPPSPLARALARREGEWGIAIDPALAERLALAPGDRVEIGRLAVRVRALIARQPDRSLRADWRGLPVLIEADALPETGLVQPGSRLEYHYRVRTRDDPEAWRAAFLAAFPRTDAEIRTFAERGQRLAENLDQIASGLLIVGLSALFIGGLGVLNSIHAYLRGKLATVATLRALGLRPRPLAAVYVCQVLMLAGGASAAGALAGGALALAGAALAADRLPFAPALGPLLAPLGLAWLFGVLVALTFAVPAIGRALSVTPAVLFRGLGAQTAADTPRAVWAATAGTAVLTLLLVLVVLPDPLFAAGFLLAGAALLALLEALVRLVRHLAARLLDRPALAGRPAWRLALAALCRPGSPLRAALLSLGSAATLLVASALVVGTLLETLSETLPEHAPALVLYDISPDQLDGVQSRLEAAPSLERLELAPLVLGRLSHVNGEALRESPDPARAREARDEHKLTHRRGNIDRVLLERGAWWPAGYRGPPVVAMEDREAEQLGLRVGDALRFRIMDETVDAELVAIYGQRRLEARFWFEAIFPDGALDPFVTRYVGTAYLDPGEARAAQARIAAFAPNVITVHTEGMLDEARALLARAAAGLAVVAGATLLASLLVLASAIAASRVRQIYTATVLHVLGTRTATIRLALALEYALLGALVAAFALGLGNALATALLHFRLELSVHDVAWLGVATAIGVSAVSLGLGAQSLLRELRLEPARLLRAGG